MSDIMRIQPFATQLRRILKEYEANSSIFGIHKSFFYAPAPDARFATPDVYGQYLATEGFGPRGVVPRAQQIGQVVQRLDGFQVLIAVQAPADGKRLPQHRLRLVLRSLYAQHDGQVV